MKAVSTVAKRKAPRLVPPPASAAVTSIADPTDPFHLIGDVDSVRALLSGAVALIRETDFEGSQELMDALLVIDIAIGEAQEIRDSLDTMSREFSVARRRVKEAANG